MDDVVNIQTKPSLFFEPILLRRIKITFTTLARNLRKNQTDVEQILWLQLRNRRLLNYKFRRQFPIVPYIVDFVCLDLKLIIELDGSQHSEQVDEERTLFLGQRGFRVMRFWNNDLLNNLEGVLAQINLIIIEQKKVL
ncbi:MAG: endonuclease domain-containing protein [Methyloprofundus sp.]|nr:endonuclease domain-containing protein [Methyloprofundus sp.]